MDYLVGIYVLIIFSALCILSFGFRKPVYGVNAIKIGNFNIQLILVFLVTAIGIAFMPLCLILIAESFRPFSIYDGPYEIFFRVLTLLAATSGIAGIFGLLRFLLTKKIEPDSVAIAAITLGVISAAYITIPPIWENIGSIHSYVFGEFGPDFPILLFFGSLIFCMILGVYALKTYYTAIRAKNLSS